MIQGIKGNAISLAQKLETTASWAMGMGVLSVGFSLGRRIISYYRPEWDSIPIFVKLLPMAQPLLRSAGWGATFGVYAERTTSFFKPFKIPDVLVCYGGAAGLASVTMEQLAGGHYWEYLEIGKPFAFFLAGSYVARQIALQFTWRVNRLDEI